MRDTNQTTGEEIQSFGVVTLKQSFRLSNSLNSEFWIHLCWLCSTKNTKLQTLMYYIGFGYCWCHCCCTKACPANILFWQSNYREWGNNTLEIDCVHYLLILQFYITNKKLQTTEQKTGIQYFTKKTAKAAPHVC